MANAALNAMATAWWKKSDLFPDGAMATWSDIHVDPSTRPLTTDPRKTEGLLERARVEGDQSLYYYGMFQQMDPTLRDVVASVFQKGNPLTTTGGDAPTPYGWALDVNDMSGWKVYGNSASITPSTTILVPVAQGPYNYGAFKLSLDPAAVQRHQKPSETSTTTTSTTLPPGPGQAPVGPLAETTLLEFSINASGDGFWVAKLPALSAAKKEGNPHPGISGINPGTWERVSGGLSPREALGLEEYISAGWKGLDRHIVAWQADTNDMTPAADELKSAITAAMNGDRVAQSALIFAGIKPPTVRQSVAGTLEMSIAEALGDIL